MVDEDGNNPIYSVSGNFLGTDDKGLNGDYIVMNEESFQQGMTHEDALYSSIIGPLSDITINAINEHYNMLSSRPDYDGVVTIAEGIAWAKSHVGALDNPTPDNTLYIDASKIDFGSLYVDDPVLKKGSFELVNLYSYVSFFSSLSIYATYALVI